jgi:transposase
MIKYKAELSGMNVVMLKEAFTSISSAIDMAA